MTTDERISALESHLDALRTEQADLRGQLREAQVDRWQGRIDDLELQLHLGVLEGSDRVSRATATLQHTWDQARAELLDTSSDASEAAQRVGERLQGAYDDVRASLIEAKNSLTR